MTNETNIQSGSMDGADPMPKPFVVPGPGEGVRFGESPTAPKGVPKTSEQSPVTEGHIANGNWEVDPADPSRGIETSPPTSEGQQ